MIVGGCDIGSTTTKAVVMKDGEIIGSHIARSTVEPQKTSVQVMSEAVKKGGLSSIDDLENVIGMGHGRLKVMFANDTVSEISCHAKGVHYLLPDTRTLIDVGGQDSKMISVSKNGSVLEFKMNDRCAAGTGKFFEAMAIALDIGVEGISASENQGKNPHPISNQCSVFAESEVISLLSDGVDLKDIISGINDSVASRLCGMAKLVGHREKVAFSGGCSKNSGLVSAIEARLGTKIQTLPLDPQLAGAVGAALFAAERLEAKGHLNQSSTEKALKCPRCNKIADEILECEACHEIFCKNCYLASHKTTKSVYAFLNLIPRCPVCDTISKKRAMAA